ncbi:DUF1569 domain-containing protein [Mucilaginibacter paludis]|uniref:DUF1569 domain-containing protein n=1 Tax=Mucilaginibacter paludis DSM 18603 TaxID=714943 RepID=H1YCS3_9SPHI|nr:DUF1569 domain-containing protein [Mucilaginibacter paludis]EHQ24260.1 hypothetical protein Mucpa_0057 [Mucilaginibacter paludis DSM 18603]
METIFNDTDREELISRISLLNNQSQPQWGRMTAYQMLRHCVQWEEMALGKTQYKQTFIGRLFGKMALKDMLKDTPIKHNLPTVPAFKVSQEGDASAEKETLIARIQEHARLPEVDFVHPFFGHLNSQQGGIIAYKHADHHLKQFGI